MPKNDKINDFLARLEVILAIILFFVMLISCGMYIDIKMNGKSSSLPTLPEKERAMLSMSSIESNVNYQDDLLEPTFIGMKIDDEMIAAGFNNSSRRALEKSAYDAVVSLFLGKSESIKFDNNDEYDKYISSLKNGQKYIIMSFFSDITSSVFMPCFSSNYGIHSSIAPFYVKHMFIIADEDDNLYAVCISEDNEVTKLLPKENVSFSKLFLNSYDINDGFCRFEYLDTDEIRPVITSTLNVNNYSIDSLAKTQGKELGSEWIVDMLELFGFNMSLVKSFSSGDKTEMNFVDELSEMLIKDDGTVSFKSTDNNGINLSEFLDYYPENVNRYTFNDKVFAIKNIVNEIQQEDDNVSFNIVDVRFENESDTLRVFLKTMIDGIFLSENEYDAEFDIKGNSLIRAEFLVVLAKRYESSDNLIPQKYASYLFDGSLESFAVLKRTKKDSDLFVPAWFGSEGAEVTE